VIKIHKRICRPNVPLQFFASDDLAWVFQELLQNLKGLFLKANLDAVLAQFA